ncbi:hypothetical protein DDZ14_09430 [Maritimibacter sp. 55A14]|uniref:DUF2182 domain-containing protein n=1 Tax=Maritimibacter sp. 55A14 TaxID=2174844 RepID=UPI000D609A33|nr:DUF2182 domain-containing protein [Maritimibacter sp. 55A14]PWE32605.1 hypothetical protein DDZ14_09430 [Maritimibacter sp. 55A14]
MSRTGKTRTGLAERLMRNDRRIVMGAVGLIVLGAGAYTVAGVGMNMSALQMTRMTGAPGTAMQMGENPGWSLSYAILIFLMWWIMMVAMMTPSAAPMLLLYTALKKAGPDSRHAARLSLVFLGGYLAAWAAFSVLATGLQYTLERVGLVASAMMMLNSGLLAGVVLIAAGLYQFSHFKDACLAHCRSPAQFLTHNHRPGAAGAFRLGAHHGIYCLGCCWALMALLFVGGIMNLYWIVGLALFVLAEKLLPRVGLLVRGSGAALIAAGGLLIVWPML